VLPCCSEREARFLDRSNILRRSMLAALACSSGGLKFALRGKAEALDCGAPTRGAAEARLELLAAGVVVPLQPVLDLPAVGEKVERFGGPLGEFGQVPHGLRPPR
jgi:hypothetical protein